MAILEHIEKVKSDPKLERGVARAAAARTIGEFLKHLRAKSGQTQKEIAKTLGVKQARISQAESGKVDNLPPIDFIFRFARACGETLEIIRGSELAALQARLKQYEENEKSVERANKRARSRVRRYYSGKHRKSLLASDFSFRKVLARVEAAEQRRTVSLRPFEPEVVSRVLVSDGEITVERELMPLEEIAREHSRFEVERLVTALRGVGIQDPLHCLLVAKGD